MLVLPYGKRAMLSVISGSHLFLWNTLFIMIPIL